jgi:hypothetical protein
MALGISLILATTGLYVLLVRGVIWKILVGVFAFLGMHAFLISSLPITAATCFSFGDSTFSYASVIPAFVILMASFYTRGR